MSVLDDFARIRLYRQRASEFEWLADNEPMSNVRLRYRIIARHYIELADREEQADKAKMAERLAQLKRKRVESAQQLFFLGSHFQSYRQFQADCQSNTLPAYAFIEPERDSPLRIGHFAIFR